MVKGAYEPMDPIAEPEIDEEAAIKLFDRTVDQPYRGMLDAAVESGKDGDDGGEQG